MMSPVRLSKAFATSAKMLRCLIDAMPGLTREEIAQGVASTAAFCEAFEVLLRDLPTDDHDTELVLEDAQ